MPIYGYSPILKNLCEYLMTGYSSSETEFRIAEYYAYHNKKIKALYYCIKSMCTDFKHDQAKMRVLFALKLNLIFRIIWVATKVKKLNKHQ